MMNIPLSESRVTKRAGAEPKIYTVSELNREVRGLLETRYGGVWVEGEISNLKYHSSGHIYLSLKDSVSQISAAFFSRYNQGLKFELKDGQKVIAFGQVSLYDARGQYQLYIHKLEPQGVGALQLAFLQLKEKLEKEGLFAPERKRPIPQFPRVVGIVTSPTGAAIQDMLNVISRRFGGTRVLIYPAKVQGEGAAQEVAAGIEALNELQEDVPDVLIVGRGGGSLEDLWAFNEEIVARAVFRSQIPVISAVGHEIDWTICDLVADLRAPTPSAAAELVVQNAGDIQKQVADFGIRMRNAAASLIEHRKKSLQTLRASYAFQQPRVLVDQFSQRFDEILRQFQNYGRNFIEQKKQALQTAAGQLRVLSPLGVLERGYSLTTRPDGQLLRQFNQVRPGDEIKTRLAGGLVYSKVTKVEKGA